MEPEVSIVIVSMNTRDWLRQCLDSLIASDDVAQEVVVVDNISEDGSPEMVRAEFPQVRLVRNQEQYGFSQNNNIGARKCHAPILLFLNPDTQVLAGSLRTMLDIIATSPGYGVFGGRLLDADEQVERSTGAFPTFLSVFLDRFLETAVPLRPLFNGRSQRHYLGYDAERQVDWITGAYFWIRRDLLEMLGGWDNDFFMYYEDADLCYRAAQDGYGTLYVPQSTIYHYHNKTPIDRPRRKKLMKEGFRNFARKHYGSVARWLSRFR